MNVIQTSQVHKSYDKKPVLKAIDLSIERGEFFALIGANGSGKSTLIKCLLDLTNIDSGKISIGGQSHRLVAAREAVAYLPDRFAPPAYLTAGDFLRYILSLHGVSVDTNRLNEMMQSLAMDMAALSLPVIKLSKGMVQKLGLAACILSDKTLFILDEPMSGLDPKARVLVKREFESAKQRGVSLFFSSHVLVDVDELADKMAVLHEGEILFNGTPTQFKQKYNSDSLEQAYMACIKG